MTRRAPLEVTAPLAARDAQCRMRALANPADAIFLQRFFRTAPGEYGAGDRFLGVRVPAVRRVARDLRAMPLRECLVLLRSPMHEERLLALAILSDTYARPSTSQAGRAAIYRAYLANARRVNNWDLVDLSAHKIVGAHLLGRNRAVLDRLATSTDLWERRIAIVATHAFIRAGDVSTTLRLARTLLRDPHDLIHKATGWMLREAAKRDGATVRVFLDRHADEMPRTMLRYAIERFSAAERTRWMARGKRK